MYASGNDVWKFVVPQIIMYKTFNLFFWFNEPSVLKILLKAVLLLSLLSLSCISCSTGMSVIYNPGEIVKVQGEYGYFYVYIPTILPDDPDILVLVHGTPPKDGTSEASASFYAASWIDFAEDQGYILIAPTFNQQDFSSRYGDRALSGYRGLFGREIGADEWLLQIVRAYQDEFGILNQSFNIYGHSAGGQFTARFVVTHPEVIKMVVITSAATYPQPTDEVAWPFGMGELHERIVWDDGTSTEIDFTPDRDAWLAATQVPLTVIVGLDDTAELPIELIPAQKGRNRFTIARNWVNDMRAFADKNGMESRFNIWIIPGKGHSMMGLLEYSQSVFEKE